ncbi:hypothetical protein [Streptomyces neyagawaensis]|uniref:Secreted protein n=1 Tax=Streptomyces neyagawaensis TaxID=42238 RepID=A0ABV3B7E8_9ACTN
MPRGRHRHSPPLHRLLPPTAIAGVSLVCALGPWVFSGPAVLRVLAALAAATAAVGAAVMRRWDLEAGKRVADLTRARASDEWRHEERVAELETDLEESRELRTKLERKLRAKRTELANLRNEHAALLRRYATAETERASALEGRRLLEIETTVPEGARELTAGGEGAESTGDASAAVGSGAASGTAGAGAPSGIVGAARGRAAAQASPVPPRGVPAAGAPWGARGAGVDAEDVESADVESAEDGAGDGGKPASGVFSPAGSALWLRANSALERIITQRGTAKGAGRVSGEDVAAAGAGADTGVVAVAAEAEDQERTEDQEQTEAGTETRAEAGVSGEVESGADVADADADAVAVAVAEAEAGGEGDVVAEVEADGAEAQGLRDGEGDDQATAQTEAAVEAGQSGQPGEPGDPDDERVTGGPAVDEPVRELSVKDGSGKGGSPEDDPDGPNGGGTRQGRSAEGDAVERVPVVTAEEDDPAGKPGAVDEHERAAAQPVPAASVPAAPVPAQSQSELSPQPQSELSPEPALPALPVVRPAGHFTVPTAVAVVPAAPQRRTAVEGGFDFFGTQKEADVIEAVQNEDLADVVGQEALALHKAESEAQFKRRDEAARGVGQVIDLTAHDETEQIDLKGLRTAAS